jgi:3-hydroxymyristoyl/3-hydroxydecanoyl-(acyl carrier protein) dehydratases
VSIVWSTLENAAFSEGSLVASFTVPKQSAWIEGHFPNNPVIPGIAMISLLLDTIDLFGERNGIHYMMTQLRQVRFRKKMEPPARLMVKLTPPTESRGGDGRFVITNYGDNGPEEIVCAGIVALSSEDSAACPTPTS